MPKKVSQISSTPRIDRGRLGAFTLVELMVGASLSAIILAGVLSAFIMMARVSANIQNYTDIENTARKTLEIFSRDARLAYKVDNFTASEVELFVPDNTADPEGDDSTKGAYSVVYKFDPDTKEFTRTTDVGGVVATTVLISNVEPIPDRDAFIYYRYITGLGYVDGDNSNLATPGHPLEVKQIEINFLLNRTTSTVATASNKVLSARFILRNK
jgi:type II secretory pathway pseudopilin PulG